MRGLKLPVPAGDSWEDMLRQHTPARKGGQRRRMPRKVDNTNKYAEMVCLAYEWMRAGLIPLPENMNPLETKTAVRDDMRASARPKKKGIKAVGTMGEAPPRSVEDALNHPTRARENGWRQSLMSGKV